MATVGSQEFNASDLMKGKLEVTVTIKGWRWWNAKQFIGLRIIKLGAWITGIKVNTFKQY